MERQHSSSQMLEYSDPAPETDNEHGFEIVKTESIFENVFDYLSYFLVVLNLLKTNWTALYEFAYKILNNWSHQEYSRIQESDSSILPENPLIRNFQSETELIRNRIQKDAESKSSKFEKRRAEEMEKLMMEMEESDKEFQRDSERRRLESQRKMEELKERTMFEQFLKDQNVSLENDIFTKQGLLEIDAIRKARKESNANFESTSSEMDRKFEENLEASKAEDETRRNEIQRQKEESETRRERIQEKHEEEMENLKKLDESRRRGMDEQIFRIQKVMKMKMANEVMERNWTERLNKLRNSFNNFKISEISRQKVFLETEKSEMRRMYEETGKTFLLDIEEKIAEILEETDRLEYVLTNEPDNKERIDGCHSALKRGIMEIPTLAELKKRYEEENDF